MFQEGFDEYLLHFNYYILISDCMILQSTGVPSVWVSTDHLCIVWCKQLVLVLARALFDIVDPVTRQISTDYNFRNQVFHYHFIHVSLPHCTASCFPQNSLLENA